MAQDPQSTAEELQVPETTTEAEQVPETTEATAEQSKIAIAPVALPPKQTSKVEVPQLEQKLSHPTVADDHQEVVAHEDEKVAFSNIVHDNLGEEEGGVEGELGGDILSELQEKLSLDRKQNRKEAFYKRYSFGSPNEAHSEMAGEEEEDSDEEYKDYMVEYKEEDNVQPIAAILDEEGDKEKPKLKTRFEGSITEGIFGVLPESTARGSKEIFCMDPIYDNSEVVSLASLKSTKSTKSIKADTIQMKEEFLRNFEMPSLSDISEEHEPDDLSLDNVSVASMAEVKGHFTDPLAGDYRESSSVSSEVVSLSEHEEQDDAAAAVSSPESSSDFSEIPDLPASPDEAPKRMTISFDVVPTSLHAIQVADEDVEERPKKNIWVDTMIQDFVNGLVDQIVTAYERHQSDNRLRSMCDRGKLLAELKNVTDTYVFERYTNEMLNTRLVEYFKRIRNNRVFEDEKEDQYVRYYEALTKVDELNLRLDAIKYKFEEQIARVRLELHTAQHFVLFTEARLESKVRKILVRQDSDFLRRYVDWALRQMCAKRNEISDMRLVLMLKKSTLAELQTKLTELESLSSTVSIQDFLSIQNDIISLGKKIEERNVDLNKIRAQYLMDVHITHHNREKALALGDKLKHMKTTLANVIDKQRALRASLYSKKLERTRMREKRKELTFQGGILAMPALMYEYDKTVELVKESQKRVTKLRDTVEAINHRVSLVSRI